MLAEFEPTFLLMVGAVVAVLYYLVAGWNQVEEFLDRRKEHPPAHQVYATKEALAKTEADLSDEISQVDSKVETLRADIVRNGEQRKTSIEAKVEAVRMEVRQDIQELHTKVNQVDKTVAANTTATQLLHGQLVALDGRLQNLSVRTPKP
jgi:hypothetical protein